MGVSYFNLNLFCALLEIYTYSYCTSFYLFLLLSFCLGFRARRDRAPGERGPPKDVLEKARGILANNIDLVVAHSDTEEEEEEEEEVVANLEHLDKKQKVGIGM